MTGLFYVTDHDGNRHVMTDRELRNLIIKQSRKSDYNWLAPANELLKTCNDPKFNKCYAKDIKVAIVNCYANFLKKDCPGDIVYAFDAYNELFECHDEQVLEARKKFLKAFIIRNIFWNKHFGNIDETFWKARDKWIDDVTEELLKVRHVYFNLLKDDLVRDFEKYIDEEMDKGNVKEKNVVVYMNFNAERAISNKEVYSDKDVNQKETINLENDKMNIKKEYEVKSADGYKSQGEKKSKSSKGIMKIFRRKKKY